VVLKVPSHKMGLAGRGKKQISGLKQLYQQPIRLDLVAHR